MNEIEKLKRAKLYMDKLSGGVDGYEFHKEGTKQHERDMMKNHILELYNIPFLRFSTVGSGEKEKLINKLNELI